MRINTKQRIVLGVFIIVAVAGGVWSLQQRSSEEGKATEENTSVSSSVPIPETSEAEPVAEEKRYAMEIWVDSAGDEVNVVEAKIAYPTEELKVVSITPGEAFPNKAAASDRDGIITVTRFTHPGTSVLGRQLVATLYFEKQAETVSELRVMDDSGLLRVGDGANVLSDVEGAGLTLVVADGQ